MEEINTENVASANEVFSIRKANEWLGGAAKREPAMLFDEFWQEGEMARLIAKAESGKSVLATQIAESIARSRPDGKRIFIEAEDLRSRPVVWYWFRSGRKFRSERGIYGISEEKITELNHTSKYRGRVM